MFNKYNEKARRALYFARYEASKMDSLTIESEHVLLGILREGEETALDLLAHFEVRPEDLRREIEEGQVFTERISSTAELPLCEETRSPASAPRHLASSAISKRIPRSCAASKPSETENWRHLEQEAGQVENALKLPEVTESDIDQVIADWTGINRAKIPKTD